MSRTLVVTGAASGIGYAVLIAAARRGWSVAAVDIDLAGATTAAEAARQAGAPDAVGLDADVGDEESVASAFDAALTSLGSVDSVLANAGIEVNAPLHDFPLRDWDRVINVNLTGVFLTLKHGIRAMRPIGRGGSLVCTSSPAAFRGFAGGGNAAYGSSKGGVAALVRSVALDYASEGIRVNAVVPGATDTPLLLAGVEGSRVDERAAEIARLAEEQIPLGRLAKPAEVAAAALWLLSEESSYVTGSHLVCDGGLLAKSAHTF